MAGSDQGLLHQALRDLTYSEARILVVDDDPAMIMYLQGLLERAGYTRLLSTTDAREVPELFEEGRPDLVLLDLQMPFMDGFAVMDALRKQIPGSEYLPILVITANIAPEVRWRALYAGARDFLQKPFEPLDLLLRLHNLLQARFLHLQLENKNSELADRVRERTQAMVDAQNDTIERLAQAVEFHDDATGKHTRRVGGIAAQVAELMSMSPTDVELIRRTAPLHDVGKIGIPDAILLKPGRLTPDEFEVVKMHTSIGARILSGGRSEYLSMAEQIALGHHERWDGGGYPKGLSAEETPLVARIVAVADFYDALTHDRPYRPAWAPEQVLQEVNRQSGHHFDPHVVQAFLAKEIEPLPANGTAPQTVS